MNKASEKISLTGMSVEQLREVCAQCDMPAFAARQMAKWLYEKRVDTIDQMTDLSLKARATLNAAYTIGRYAPKAEARSSDGTVKYLFDGAGGCDIEAVYIPTPDRATLCVSSQAGCRMRCTFCMTGRQGWHGNLTAGHIINQVLSIPESHTLTNIVFMGMGEPTDNLPEVMKAIEILTAAWGLAWSPKRITVSSIGRVKPLRQLLDQTRVHIAISLHSPFAQERASLMPIEKASPAKEVLDMLRGYDFAHQRRLSMEYIMWKGVNDDLKHADALARELRGLDCRVNLIRFHAIPDSPLRTSSDTTMETFRDRLNALGITATIRTSRGEDIQAACGMLAGRKK